MFWESKKLLCLFFFENTIFLKYIFFIFLRIRLSFFLGMRTFSNVNVLHKGLLLQDWVFRLGMERGYSIEFLLEYVLSFSVSYTSKTDLNRTFSHAFKMANNR